MNPQNINFVPSFILKEREQKKRMLVIIVFTVVITLICFAIYFIPQYKLFSLTNAIENNETEIKYAQEEYKLLKELEKNQEIYDKKKSLLNQIGKDQINVSIIMEKLSKTTPKGVIFSYFSLKGTTANIKYTVNTPLEISELVEKMQDSKMFEEVEMPNVPIVDRKTDVVFKLKLSSDFIKNNKIETKE